MYIYIYIILLCARTHAQACWTVFMMSTRGIIFNAYGEGSPVYSSRKCSHSKMWIEHAWGKLICLWLVFVWKKMRSLGAQDTNCLTASLLYNAFPILLYCAWSVVPKSILPMILHDSTSYYQWLVWFQKWGHWEVMSTKAFLLRVIFEATSLHVSLCWGFIISIMVQIRS